ncbi:MAG: TlpA disulfide reductase family protein [bacterium]
MTLRTASLGILLALTVAAPPPSRAEDNPPPAAEGASRAKAPGFHVVDVKGDKVSLDDLLGKGPVVIDFWATWCKPCIKELPYLQRILDQYGKRGVQVCAVTIDSPKSQSQVKKFVDTRNYTFRVLMDGDQEVFHKLQGKGSIPYVVVLDSQGFMRFQHTGYVPGNEKEIERVVVELLGGAGEAPQAEATPDTTK